jgi:hypothetical protein
LRRYSRKFEPGEFPLPLPLQLPVLRLQDLERNCE